MQHIEHLSALLHDHVHHQSDYSLSPTDTIGFFQTIRTARIHFNRLDWQGHSVATLLWHMPNLRPEKKTSLVNFIVHQWIDYIDSTTDKGKNADSANSPAGKTAPAQGAPPPQTQNNQPDDATVPQTHFLSTLPAPRRDWFDRFTDWVAAVISLFA